MSITEKDIHTKAEEQNFFLAESWKCLPDVFHMPCIQHTPHLFKCKHLNITGFKK